MSKPVKILGEVKQGVYNAYDTSLKCTGRAVLMFEGKILEVSLRTYKEFKQRTGQQNRYYHGVVISHCISAIQELWGETWTIEQIKQYHKERFGLIEYEHDNGITVVYKSTADYSVEELVIFIEAIRDHFAKDFCYYIPSSNETRF